MDFTCKYTLLENREYRNYTDDVDNDNVENVANLHTHYSGNTAELSSGMLDTYLKKAMRRLTIRIYCTKR